MKRVFFGFCFLLLTVGCQKQKLSFPHSTTWGFSLDGFPITDERLAQLQQETKITPPFIQFYLQWPNASEAYKPVISSLEAILRSRAIPVLTWEPMLIIQGKEETIPYEQILENKYLPYLTKMAHEIKEWKKPLIIRFAHEMNLKRYHWGTSQEQFGPSSPEIYVKMFRYMVETFRNLNVDNVLWAFCPNANSVPNEQWNQAAKYYPGNDVVDILGMDGYNWAMDSKKAKAQGKTWTSPWASFQQIFQGLHDELKHIAPRKPIIVFETATVKEEEGKKSLWIKEAVQTAKKWKLAGIIWFQSNKEEDWRF